MKIRDILLVTFIILYVVKQAYLFDIYTNEINYFLTTLLLMSLMVLLTKFCTIDDIYLNKSYLYLLMSLVGSLFLFYNIDDYKNLLKLIAVIPIILLYSKNYGKLLIISSNAMFAAVTAIIFLSVFGIVEGRYYENVNWVKYSAGFKNPNIPPFFLLSCALGYFAVNNYKKFYMLVIAYFIFYNFLNIHSRVATIGIISLLCFLMAKIIKAEILLIKFLAFCALILFLAVLLLITSDIAILDNSFLFHVDEFLSGRLLYLLRIELIWESLSHYIYIPPVDMFYLELMKYFGIYPLILLIAYLINWFVRKDANSLRGHNFNISFIVILLCGFFEGFLLKITPSLFLIIVFFMSIFLANAQSRYGIIRGSSMKSID